MKDPEYHKGDKIITWLFLLYNTYPQARELMETIDLPLKKYPEIAMLSYLLKYEKIIF